MVHKETLLMTAGPTMLPKRVLDAMNRQIIHHRSRAFEEVLTGLQKDLQYVFQTVNTVLILASSGTGAMEAAVVNLFSPGDKVLVLSNGMFGERLAEVADVFGLNVQKLTFGWGQAVNIHTVADTLEKDDYKEIKAVLMVHHETSTGVTNNVEAVCRLLEDSERLSVVDAVSSLGGLELQTDNWGVDVVISSSQKALMAPPGLAFVSMSRKAWKRCADAGLPRFYWDFRKYGKGFSGELACTVPYTPAVSLLVGQAEALRMIREEGLQNVYERHKKLALAVRAGIKAMGLSMFPDEEDASYIITSVKPPEGIDMEEVRRLAEEKYGVMITCGQRRLKGKLFRIGHCGYVNMSHIITTIEALENALSDSGYHVEKGKAVQAVRNTVWKPGNTNKTIS